MVVQVVAAAVAVLRNTVAPYALGRSEVSE